MSWTGKNNLKTLCVDVDFFINREKKTFSKVSGYMWTCKNDLKVLCVDTDFIENRRKKVPFSRLVNERCAISKLTSRWSA